MTDTVTVQEENGVVVVQEVVPEIIEIITAGPQGAQGIQGIQGAKGDTGDVTPAATAAKVAAEAAATAAASAQTAAAGSASSALASQTAAAGSATAAGTSASTAATQASNASTSATNAAGSAIAAASSAATAGSQATTATTQAANAATSATNAAASATTATTKAAESATSATSASGSASSAAASASTATTKATEASTSAATASTMATAAQIAAAGSLAHEQTAAEHSLDASTSADSANTSAIAASASKDSATASATAASGSAATATTQAGNAAASGATAETQAGIATTKASEAAASASAAAASASAAQTSQTASAASAAAANTSAGSAAGSASSALAIYGTTNAQQAALVAAQSAASLAQGYALSASSAIQQDLSGVTAQALHRSPNAVTAMFVYDTSKDSDGGAWTEKCQHTSWYNEALNGKWLGAWLSESDARILGAPTLGTELVTNGDFSQAGTGYVEVLNGTISYSNQTMLATATTGNTGVYRDVVVTANKLYRVGWRQVSGTSRRINIYDGAGFGTSLYNNGTGDTISGDRVVAVRPTSTTLRIYLHAGTGTTAEFDNISVREVTALTTASGDYYQSTVDGKFYKLNPTSGVTETFRGNKADFPRLAGIVAEAQSVTIYDLTEAGRPMWRRFVPVETGSYANSFWRSFPGVAVSSISSANGKVVVGTNGTDGQNSVMCFDMPSDQLYRHGQYLAGVLSVPVAACKGGWLASGYSKDLPKLTNGQVNAVAMTVLPDAPVDPVTGLQVPTIAVGTAGGVSVIKDDGTVRNSSATSAFRSVAINSRILAFSYDVSLSSGQFNYAATSSAQGATPVPPRQLGASFAMGYDTSSVGPDFNIGTTTAISPTQASEYLRRASSLPMVQKMKMSESAIGKSVTATIRDTFNTGHLIGDIKRCFLADVDVGSAPVPNPVVNGNFSSADLSNWGAQDGNMAFSIEAGALKIYKKPTGGSTYCYYNLATTPGVKYTVTADFVIGTAGAVRYDIRDGWYGGTTLIASPTPVAFSVDSTQTATFTALSNSTSIRFVNNSFVNDTYFYVDNIVVTQIAVPDRSYKTAQAPITGTLTKTQVAAASQLVAYSGFSAANYLREPWSADLDFGTGEWSASAWVNVPAYQQLYQNLFPNSNTFASGWGQEGVVATSNYETAGGLSYTRLQQPAVSTGGNRLWVGSPTTVLGLPVNTSIYVRKVAGSTDRLILGFIGNWAPTFNSTYYDPVTQTVSGPNAASITVTVIDANTARISASNIKGASSTSSYWTLVVVNASGTSFGGDTGGVAIAGFQMTVGAALLPYEATGATVALRLHPIADRAHSSGARVAIGFDGAGFLTATAFDGTTTRTVTTTAAYNTATWIKPEAVYTTDGTLAIRVNGVEVAATRGTPLLTLNNSNAVLTIGNSYALDAPFPGSIALLKMSATVPTAEQGQWMYEQEKQMFRDGAQVCLPDSGSIVDLTYDDATDKWIAVSAANESEWSGLVRTSVTASPAGSYTKVAAASGVQLQARSTTSPGVDITIPSYGLREELVRRAESAARLARNMVTFDYVGGFTANTTTGSTAIASVASLTYPVSYVGARISGAGIPANTTVVAVSGTTIYMSAAATATASAVQISFVDFNLPLGYEAKEVSTAGAAKIEGSTKDFTRLFDGFKETIRFGTAPGYNVAVQIQATRSAA